MLLYCIFSINPGYWDNQSQT